jgi:hypothetical protein
MPIPMTIEMNITENSDRWPMMRVAAPSDQTRATVRTTVISKGLTTRMKPSSSRSSVRAKASRPAFSLSRKAATISSFERAGLPVTPTSISGNSARRAATVARTPSIASRLPVNEPAWLRGSARTKRSR